MLHLFHKVIPRQLDVCWAIVLCALLTDYATAQPPESKSPQAEQEAANLKKNEPHPPDIQEVLPPEIIAVDLEQFRNLLQTEWLAATLSDADYDAAVTDLAKRSADGMSRSDFIVELQKILALGIDGHAGIANLGDGLMAFHENQGYPDFIIDICGDDYIAYREEPLPEGFLNPRDRFRYKLLREGFPYLSAIDGVPIEKWVKTIPPFVPKGPELSVRWRCVELIHYLPFWRNQMGLPQSNRVKVQLTSPDHSQQIELEAPVRKNPLVHFRIPKPDWKIIDREFGYVWLRDSYGGSSEVVLEAMPRLRGTKGLIIDLRDNLGGGTEPFDLMSAFLLPPDNPRRVVGSRLTWSGRKPKSPYCSADDDRLSVAGRKAISTYLTQFTPHFNLPSHRAVQWQYMLLSRPEAEPSVRPFNAPQFPKEKYYHYAAPVVVLMDHRCFSAAEIFLAGIQTFDNVTLVGSPTTSAGGISPGKFKLEKSEIWFFMGSKGMFVQTNGDLIDGKGIRPDIVVFPDVDYYLGRRDRMLETAIEVLKKKIAMEH